MSTTNSIYGELWYKNLQQNVSKSNYQWIKIIINPDQVFIPGDMHDQMQCCCYYLGQIHLLDQLRIQKNESFILPSTIPCLMLLLYYV